MFKAVLTASLLAVTLPLIAQDVDLSDLQDTPRASQPTKVLWESPEPQLRLPVEDIPSSLTLELPAAPATAGKVALRFRARFDFPVVGGVARSLGIKINGEALTPDHSPALNRTHIELRSGPMESTSGWWGRVKERWVLLLDYSPSAQELEPQIVTDREERHWYLIDVTSFLRNDTPNELTLENLITSAQWNRPERMEGIILEGLTLVEVDAPFRK